MSRNFHLRFILWYSGVGIFFLLVIRMIELILIKYEKTTLFCALLGKGYQEKAYLTMLTMKLLKNFRFSNSGLSTNKLSRS